MGSGHRWVSPRGSGAALWQMRSQRLEMLWCCSRFSRPTGRERECVSLPNRLRSAGKSLPAQSRRDPPACSNGAVRAMGETTQRVSTPNLLDSVRTRFWGCIPWESPLLRRSCALGKVDLPLLGWRRRDALKTGWENWWPQSLAVEIMNHLRTS